MKLKNLKILALLASLLFTQTVIAQTSNLPEALCQKGRFKPCICVADVPKEFSYIPAYAGCAGNAAVISRGRFLNIFSVVVRDTDNRDRFPSSGFGGCSINLANSKNPPNKCSAFKVQKTYFQDGVDGAPERVSCLGVPGSSKLFKKVVRMTAKISDVPGSNLDPLVRMCLSSPATPLN